MRQLADRNGINNQPEAANSPHHSYLATSSSSQLALAFALATSKKLKMLTTITVSAKSASGNTSKLALPAAIERVWVADLTSTILKDVRQALFGARRHLFDDYTMIYRVDIDPAVLCRVLVNEISGIHVAQGGKIPTLRDVVESAKVWLSYDEGKLVEVSLTISCQISNFSLLISIGGFRLTLLLPPQPVHSGWLSTNTPSTKSAFLGTSRPSGAMILWS